VSCATGETRKMITAAHAQTHSPRNAPRSRYSSYADLRMRVVEIARREFHLPLAGERAVLVQVKTLKSQNLDDDTIIRLAFTAAREEPEHPAPFYRSRSPASDDRARAQIRQGVETANAEWKAHRLKVRAQFLAKMKHSPTLVEAAVREMNAWIKLPPAIAPAAVAICETVAHSLASHGWTLRAAIPLVGDLIAAIEPAVQQCPTCGGILEPRAPTSSGISPGNRCALCEYSLTLHPPTIPRSIPFRTRCPACKHPLEEQAGRPCCEYARLVKRAARDIWGRKHWERRDPQRYAPLTYQVSSRACALALPARPLSPIHQKQDKMRAKAVENDAWM